ncbi:MAG: AbgT family transporter, partial [Desulfofundulus sp.]
NFSPALTQAAYRIGDTSTNIISPLSPYIPVILGLLTQFNPKKEEVGIGTYISLMLPYSIAYLIVLSVQLVIWMLLKLPLGPGAGIYL